MQTDQPFLYFAPIKGLTDALFRDTFFSHFHGFDSAIAPFINPQHKSCFDDKAIRDVLPAENQTIPVIPQLLQNDPEDFLALAIRLADLGYTHINWNLGCPVPMVAKKRRGSGLLPFPERIIGILDHVMPQLPVQVSIKTRLGYSEISETLNLLPELDRYPLKEITIHARLGKQLYRGAADPDGFARCLAASRHPLVYNGDICTAADFSRLAERFPQVRCWMIGRGALADPFLAEKIKNISPPGRGHDRLHAFHEDLVGRYEERLSGPGHLLGKVKQLWIYMIASFPGKEKQLKKILKSSSLAGYTQVVAELFDN